ncbi:MAG: rhodanese-like domain-containing protein [Cyanobacteria bacterium]|nr:rhodanese-like domain-containing protein [Cyanobacteriota bacterium]
MTITELWRAQQVGGRIRILDVRTPSEFENTHIAGAYNVPLDQLAEHAGDLRDSAGGTIVLVCQSGQRAQKAEALLREAGMPNARVLEGGMRAWLLEALPTKRIRARISLERQVRIVAGVVVAVGAFTALTVSPFFALVPLMIGTGLAVAGITDTCAMGMLLARLPYNRAATLCDTESIIQRFIAEEDRSPR